MSVVVLFGAGALIGLVALTAVLVVTLLTEKPETLSDGTETRARASEKGSVP